MKGQTLFPWKIILSLAGAVVILLGGIFLSRLSIDYDRLVNIGYGGVFVATFLGSAAGFLPAPNMAIVIAASMAWNPLGIGIFGGLGAALGEIPNYWVGLLGGRWLENNATYKRLEIWVDSKIGLIVIFATAAIPNPFFDFVAIAAGTLRISIYKFLIPCVLGRLLRFVLVSYIGTRINGV